MFPIVIPAAGYGTRSLPASKAIPKEMMTIFDRPAIQYIVEEAVKAGMEKVIFVNSRGKSSIEDHFDIQPDLEAQLEKSGKRELLESLKKLSRMIDIQSVRQKEMLGLGHAVWMARDLISSSHFGVMLGDDLIEAPRPGIGQLTDRFEKIRKQTPDAGIVMMMEVPESEVSKYGICEISDQKTFQIKRTVEKPKAKEAPSRYAILGRYFLPREIFDVLSKVKPGAIGEIQLTDALNELANRGKLFGCVLEGKRFDAGDRLGFLEASLYYALQSPLKESVRELLKEIQK